MSPNNPSDSSLIDALVKDSSDSAVDAIVRKKYAFVYRICLRRLQNDSLAADAAQAVFITLHQKRGEINRHCVLSAWLHRTALFACANAIRMETRRRKAEMAAEEEMTREASYHTSGESEIDEILDEAIASLAAADRNAILLRYADGLSVTEIAVSLRISVPAVSQRITKATQKLRRFFAKNGASLAMDGIAAILAEKFAGGDDVQGISAAIEAIHAGIGRGNNGAHGISQGVINQMRIIKIKVFAAISAGVVVAVSGTVATIGAVLPSHTATPIAPPSGTAVPWPVTQAPTSSAILAAWEKAESAFKSGLTSYQADGIQTYDFMGSTDGKSAGSIGITKNGVNIVIPANKLKGTKRAEWSWRQQGNMFYAVFDDEGKESSDGERGYVYVRNNSNTFDYMVYTSVTDYQKANWNCFFGLDPTRADYTLGGQICGRYDPLTLEDRDQEQTALAIYEENAASLSVVGPKTIAGRICYGLSLNASIGSNMPKNVHAAPIPDTIYFAYITPDMMIPIRQISSAAALEWQKRHYWCDSITETFTDFAFFDGKYVLPTRLLSEESKGNSVMRFETQIKWSHLNEAFPTSSFRIPDPKLPPPKQPAPLL